MGGWVARVLTLHVFLLRGGLLVRGGLAHGPGHLGARQAVLRRGDAVCQRLTRHLPTEEARARLSGVRDAPPQLPQVVPGGPRWSQRGDALCGTESDHTDMGPGSASTTVGTRLFHATMALKNE